MTRTLLIISMFLICFAHPSIAQDPSVPMPTIDEPAAGTDVRYFVWGVSPDDVVQYERVVLFEKRGNDLLFIDEINGLKTLIAYEFFENRLWRVTYDILKDDYPNPQNIIDDYVSMGIFLNKRFGEPQNKEEIWSDGYYKNKPNRWGLAVLNDYLKLQMTWQTERTQTLMTLENANSAERTYKFRVVLTSRSIAEQIEKGKLEQALTPDLPAPLQDQ